MRTPVAVGTAGSDDLLPRARRVAARLGAELKNLILTLPEHARGGSAMARLLDVDRGTCQRVIAASRAEGLDVLSNLPGVQGLGMFVRAIERHGGDEGRVAAVDVAIDQYDRLVRDAGGSRAGLLRRLDDPDTPDAPETAQDERDARERLFMAARELVGRWSQVSASLRIYRPAPGDPESMESIGITGLIGHRARADAVPLTITVGQIPFAGQPSQNVPFESLDRTPVVGHTPSALLERFSTHPVPLVTSQVPGKDLIQMVDSTAIDPSRGADIVIGRRPGRPGPHPITESPPIHEVWSLVNYPARHLLTDVYLHRSMARQCLPSLATHLWTLNLDESLGRRWSTRFPSAPRMELLGDGPAPSDAYPRQPELTDYVFDQAGWDRAEFVGFRCAVEFPMWRTGYCMSFDFSPIETA